MLESYYYYYFLKGICLLIFFLLFFPHLTPCHLLTCVLFNTEESLSAAVVQEQFIVYTHFWSVDTLLHHLQFEEILVKTKCLFCLTLLLFFFFFQREQNNSLHSAIPTYQFVKRLPSLDSRCHVFQGNIWKQGNHRLGKS